MVKNKKIIVFICLYLINLHFLNGQITKMYHYSVEKENLRNGLISMSFKLEFDKNQNYRFSYTGLVSFDILPEPVILISQGRYSKEGNRFLLTDSKINIKMVFEEKDDSIFPIRIFSGLLNKRFNRPLNFYYYSQKLDSDNRNNCTTRRTKKSKNDSVFRTLYYGSYCDDTSIKIKFIKPDKYEYCIDDFLFSEGTFKYHPKTNELELFDFRLNSVWKLLFIEEKCLIDCQGSILSFSQQPLSNKNGNKVSRLDVVTRLPPAPLGVGSAYVGLKASVHACNTANSSKKLERILK